LGTVTREASVGSKRVKTINNKGVKKRAALGNSFGQGQKKTMEGGKVPKEM